MRLEIKDVSKSYINNKKKNKVLDNVSFNIEEGEFVTLLGPSGCGKTTLLTMIAGFHNLDSGEIILNDNRVMKPGPDRGFVFQNYALFPWMTVKDNIMYPMKQQKIPKKESIDRLNYLLEMSKLKGKENLYPNQLSGGMKQRTAVVRALASKPEVLLMDEPLGAIDFQMRQMMQEELESLWLKDKTTVIMVTHDVDEAVYLSDRVIVFAAKGGKIIKDMKISLPRPRNRDNHKYLELKKELTSILKDSLS
ncbi:ABC transporter ATP-binding protein [Clostridium botulinum A2B3 87]|uniref:ABC transporter ATP-binding protein SaoA n=1 Tax=Clostridium botulinum TaxID=1491 RepID=UPI0004A5909B|nr:ABC transporter ATP-binding protein SaoA [Clostridium botulinum]KEI96662.1 ABC transporter ATP-binding protein [Clostridium botulinum A2B3 87]